MAATFSGSSRVRQPTKLDCIATWLVNGLTGAFFASLERCSCIRISTAGDDFGEEANDVPLILDDGNFGGDHGHDGGLRRRRLGKGYVY
ncbi:Unknown protein [Striga hermonthica]|uniref:Uncharacterized protein n=1 Tax=Striga hermonthica TaxID=68872 RepID=A0A9N7P4H0_STRHE|nr:Unknown protein [Striga hermonthica]